MGTNLDKLKLSIEITRMEMIDLAHQYGFCNPSVVQCSQKLDLLLNEYIHIKLKY